MTEGLSPLRESGAPEDAEARSLLSKMPPRPDWTSAEANRAWRVLQARISSSQHTSRRLGVGLCVAAAVVSFVLLFLRPSPQPKVAPVAAPHGPHAKIQQLPTGDRILHARQAQLRVTSPEPGETRLYLEDGSITAHVTRRLGSQSFRVVTPQLVVTVVGTRFRVTVEGATSSVDVQEGRVRVSDGRGMERALGPGERVTLSGHAPAPVRATVQPEQTSETSLPAECEGSLEEGQSLKRCHSRLLEQGGLAAQNGLFILGQYASRKGQTALAVSHWKTYLERFPSGALSPEVSASLLAELLAARQFVRALEVAERVEASNDRALLNLTKGIVERHLGGWKTPGMRPTDWVHAFATGK